VLLRAGQSPLEPHLVTVTDEQQTMGEPHLQGWAAADESYPPGTWTESGQTPVLTGSLLVAAVGAVMPMSGRLH